MYQPKTSIKGPFQVNLTVEAVWADGDVQLLEIVTPGSSVDAASVACDMPLITAALVDALGDSKGNQETNWILNIGSSEGTGSLRSEKTVRVVLETEKKGMAVVTLHRSTFELKAVEYFDTRNPSSSSADGTHPHPVQAMAVHSSGPGVTSVRADPSERSFQLNAGVTNWIRFAQCVGGGVGEISTNPRICSVTAPTSIHRGTPSDAAPGNPAAATIVEVSFVCAVIGEIKDASALVQVQYRHTRPGHVFREGLLATSHSEFTSVDGEDAKDIWLNATQPRRVEIHDTNCVRALDGFATAATDATEWRLRFTSVSHDAVIHSVTFRRHVHDLSKAAAKSADDLGTTDVGANLTAHLLSRNASDVVVIAAPEGSQWGITANIMASLETVGVSTRESTSLRPWVLAGRVADASRSGIHALSSLSKEKEAGVTKNVGDQRCGLWSYDESGRPQSSGTLMPLAGLPPYIHPNGSKFFDTFAGLDHLRPALADVDMDGDDDLMVTAKTPTHSTHDYGRCDATFVQTKNPDDKDCCDARFSPCAEQPHKWCQAQDYPMCIGAVYNARAGKCYTKCTRAQPVLYFENRGDGTFVDRTASVMLHVNEDLSTTKVDADTKSEEMALQALQDNLLPAWAHLRGDGYPPDLVLINALNGADVRIYRLRYSKPGEVPRFFPLDAVEDPVARAVAACATEACRQKLNLGLNAAPAFGDLDSDGNLDLIVGGGIAPPLRHFVINAATNMLEVGDANRVALPTIFPSARQGSGGFRNAEKIVPALHDLDADGRLDILASYYSHEVHTDNLTPREDEQYGRVFAAWRNVAPVASAADLTCNSGRWIPKSDKKICTGRWFPNAYAYKPVDGLPRGGTTWGGSLSADDALVSLPFCVDALAKDSNCDSNVIVISQTNGHCRCVYTGDQCGEKVETSSFAFERMHSGVLGVGEDGSKVCCPATACDHTCQSSASEGRLGGKDNCSPKRIESQNSRFCDTHDPPCILRGTATTFAYFRDGQTSMGPTKNQIVQGDPTTGRRVYTSKTFEECKDACLTSKHCESVKYLETNVVGGSLLSSECWLYEKQSHTDPSAVPIKSIETKQGDQEVTTTKSSSKVTVPLNRILPRFAPIGTVGDASLTVAGRRFDNTGSNWEQISSTKGCEYNSEGITRTFGGQGYTLASCKQACLDTIGCKAIDFFTESSYCNHFAEVCIDPRIETDGSTSYKLTDSALLMITKARMFPRPLTHIALGPTTSTVFVGTAEGILLRDGIETTPQPTFNEGFYPGKTCCSGRYEGTLVSASSSSQSTHDPSGSCFRNYSPGDLRFPGAPDAGNLAEVTLMCPQDFPTSSGGERRIILGMDNDGLFGRGYTNIEETSPRRFVSAAGCVSASSLMSNRRSISVTLDEGRVSVSEHGCDDGETLELLINEDMMALPFHSIDRTLRLGQIQPKIDSGMAARRLVSMLVGKQQAAAAAAAEVATKKPRPIDNDAAILSPDASLGEGWVSDVSPFAVRSESDGKHMLGLPLRIGGYPISMTRELILPRHVGLEITATVVVGAHSDFHNDEQVVMYLDGHRVAATPISYTPGANAPVELQVTVRMPHKKRRVMVLSAEYFQGGHVLDSVVGASWH